MDGINSRDSLPILEEFNTLVKTIKSKESKLRTSPVWVWMNVLKALTTSSRIITSHNRHDKYINNLRKENMTNLLVNYSKSMHVNFFIYDFEAWL